MTDRLPGRPRRLPVERAKPDAGRVAFSERDGPSDEVGLRDVLGILRRRLWLFVILGLAVGAGATGWASFHAPTYEAQAVVRLDGTAGSSMGGVAGELRLLGIGGARGGPSSLLSEVELFHSQRILETVVDQVGLRLTSPTRGFPRSLVEGVVVDPDAPADTLSLRFRSESVEAAGSGAIQSAGYGEGLVFPQLRFTIAEQPPVEKATLLLRSPGQATLALEDRLTVEVREGTDVVDVRYQDPDPHFAQLVVNTAVRVFHADHEERARRESFLRRVFVEEQLSQARDALESLQDVLGDFRTRERVFSSREWFAGQQAGLMELQIRREELEADRRMYSTIMDGLQGGDPERSAERLETLVAAPEVAGNLVVGNLYRELVRYETVRDSLVGGPWGAAADNPDVAWTEQQIDNVRRRLERAVRSHLDALDVRIEALGEFRERMGEEMETLAATEAEEARLVHQVESMSRTADRLSEEYFAARMAEETAEGRVDIVDLAPLPLRGSGMSLPLVLVLGVALGLMVGGVAAFVLEGLNTSIRREEELEGALQIPAVGVIPQIVPGKWGDLRRRLLSSGRADRTAAAGPGRRSNSLRKDGRLVVTLLPEPSASSEAYRTLRTNLLFSDGSHELRSIVVTSPDATEGKTTTAANLAVAYAQHGLEVLVLDCDLRNPKLHETFGMELTPGLVEVLLDGDDPSVAVQPFGGTENLFVLLAGRRPRNPTELLGGTRMRNALACFHEQFDMVIIDTPPLAAGADGAIVGAQADGVLLVVRAGSTEEEPARHAVHQLDTVGARVIGGVLNDPDGELPKYGRYPAYSSEGR